MPDGWPSVRPVRRCKMAGRPNPTAVIEARVAEVSALASTHPSGKLVAYCRGKWKVSPRTAEDYIARARKALAAAFKEEIDAEAGIAKQRLERLFFAAEAAEDFNAAISAQRELIKLMGLAAPEKVEHSASPELAEWLAIRRGGQA
jgi:hypothetical protein